jgi:hypothetical protein
MASRRILKVAGAAAALALFFYTGAFQSPPSAQAAIPPPCPVAPGPAGAATYHILATLPVGVPPADGLCVTLPGVAPIGSGAVMQAPPACPPAAPVGAGNAASELIWANWPAACVAPMQTVVLSFTGPAGILLGDMPGAVSWSPGGVSDAWVFPADCPAGPVAGGGVPLIAVAVAPPGGPYGGVCMNFAVAGGVNTPKMNLNPAGCPLPAIAPAPPAPNPVAGPFASAAVSQIWVDWNVKCAAAGSTVSIKFMGPAGLIGPCAGCVTWLGSSATGDATILASVGGVAESPDAAALPPAATGMSSGTDYMPWAGGGVGAALLVAVAAAAWYVRRRQQA